METTTLGLDYDKCSTNVDSEELNPNVFRGIMTFLKNGGRLVYATGRMAYQLPVIMGSLWNEILITNLENPTGLHVWESGARTSNDKGEIFRHEENMLHPDQIEIVAAVAKQLQSEGKDVLLAFQKAKQDRNNNWINSSTVAWASNDNLVTPLRQRMYAEIHMGNLDDLLPSFTEAGMSKIVCVLGNGTADPSIVEQMLANSGLKSEGSTEDFDFSRSDRDKAYALRSLSELWGKFVYAGDGIQKGKNDRCVFEDETVLEYGLVVTNDKPFPDDLKVAAPYEILRNADELGERLVAGF